MKDCPLISIIVAAHNEGPNVKSTVDSLSSNTIYPKYEIILVDDGSSDNSFDFLLEAPYLDQHFITNIRFEESQGSIIARHEGVVNATGELLVFLDAHMAFYPGWLTALKEAQTYRGKNSIIVPDISVLDVEKWEPTISTGQVISIDEKLDFQYVIPEEHSAPIAIAGGCCVFMSKILYHKVGGFDIGLRRWGCLFIDLVMKVYEIGGSCYHEPSVLVGHLFRKKFPYKVNYRDLTYNKLRTGYIHFSAEVFNHFMQRLSDQPGFEVAFKDFRTHISDLDNLKNIVQGRRQIDKEWYVRKFLPQLLDPWEISSVDNLRRNGKAKHLPFKQINFKADMKVAINKIKCPSCGATNLGVHNKCLICQAPLGTITDQDVAERFKPKATHCPSSSCGAILPEGSIFCPSCGTMVGQMPEHVEKHVDVKKEKLKCPNPACGKIMSIDKKFCTACGESLV